MANSELIAGTATYKGKSKKLLKEFGNAPTTLYNSEGFYVLTKAGEQIVIKTKDWKLNEVKNNG